MPKDFMNEADVKDSVDSTARSKRSLKFSEGKTPVYFLSSKYHDGFVHWIEIDGQTSRVVCGGNLKGKGYAPDSCKICFLTSEYYKKAKEFETKGETQKAEALKKKANGFRAKYEADFIVAVGEMVKMKDGNKKIMVPDFDDAEVGIFSMTEAQRNALLDVVDAERYPFMQSREDIFNRVILVDKGKHAEKTKYSTIEFIPARTKSQAPKVEMNSDDYNLDDQFTVSESELKKFYEMATGAVSLAKNDKSSLPEEAFEADDAVEDFMKSSDEASDLDTDDFLSEDGGSGQEKCDISADF